MAEFKIRFDDGAAYERMMGVWSRLAGDIFLDWLAPPPGLRWVDIGCGNGAFTELIVERCAPAEIQGIDPSQAQLAFARTRPAARVAQFPAGRRHGAAVSRTALRCGGHGAGAFLRARSGERRRRDGAGGSPRRHDRGLSVGYAGRRFPNGAGAGRDARHGFSDRASAEHRRVAHGCAARLVDGCRS